MRDANAATATPVVLVIDDAIEERLSLKNEKQPRAHG
jgi:hypothetical protein